MTKLSNSVSAIVISLLPLLGLGLLCVFIYDSSPDATGVSIIVAIGLVGLFISYKIFGMVYRRGAVAFTAAATATPDADHPEPNEGSNFQRCTPEDLNQFIANQRNWTQKAMVSIYGDYYQRPFKKDHKIDKVSFDEEANVLTFQFKGGQQLTVSNPQDIFEANTYLKVLKADEVKYAWKNGQPSATTPASYSFTPSGRRILTEADPKNMNPRFEIGLNMPAIMILGV